MSAAASEKIGLFLPATLHQRMQEASRGKARGALQDDYAIAFRELLDALDAGEAILFAVVRGPKRRVTVRLDEALTGRLRAALAELNLKVTDFACTAVERHHPEA